MKPKKLSAAPDIYRSIRTLRNEKGVTGAELCRRSRGKLDPRTLTALEKGRIRNPSLQTLDAIAGALGVSISEIFRRAEVQMERFFHQGSQKGFCQIDFSAGVKLVSFTPLIRNFFCGKLILAPRKRIDQSLLRHPHGTFVSVIFGRFEIKVEEKTSALREGDNLFFNGILRHSFYNPLERESVMLFVTSPSFL